MSKPVNFVSRAKLAARKTAVNPAFQSKSLLPKHYRDAIKDALAATQVDGRVGIIISGDMEGDCFDWVVQSYPADLEKITAIVTGKAFNVTYLSVKLCTPDKASELIANQRDLLPDDDGTLDMPPDFPVVIWH